MSNIVPVIGKPAPQFKGMAVVQGEFKEISLSDYKGKYVVFFFYPLDFTFVCPTEIIAFSDRVKEFRDIGVEVIGCSTDSHFSHFAWINTPRKQGGLGNMDIPLLADKNCSIAKSYGVYLEEEGVTFRGLFIIDQKQNLRQVTINDLPVGRSVDETLRLVQAFQFVDKHGEDRRTNDRSQVEVEDLALNSEDATRNPKRIKRENTWPDNAVNLGIVKSESDPYISDKSSYPGECEAIESFTQNIDTSVDELSPSSSGSLLNRVHSYPVKNDLEKHVFPSVNKSDDNPVPGHVFNYSELKHPVSGETDIERDSEFQMLHESGYSSDWVVNYPMQLFGRMSKVDRKRKRLKGESYFTTGGKFVAGRQVEMVPCKCPFKCHERISNDQAQALFAEFWSLDDIEKKRKYLAELIDSSEVKRRCKSKSAGKVDGQTQEIQSEHCQETSSKSELRRTISYQYFLLVDNVRIRVCQAFFRGVLAVTEKFVRICLNKRRTSGILADMRGKHAPWNKLNEEEFHFESIPVQTVLSENLPQDIDNSQSHANF